MRSKLLNSLPWAGIFLLVLSLVVFIIPTSSGEILVGTGNDARNGAEPWSMILLGTGLIGFARWGLRKYSK